MVGNTMASNSDRARLWSAPRRPSWAMWRNNSKKTQALAACQLQPTYLIFLWMCGYQCLHLFIVRKIPTLNLKPINHEELKTVPVIALAEGRCLRHVLNP